MAPSPSHAVELTQRLIRCPSVTPHEGGALDCLEDELTALGFLCPARISVSPAIPTWFRLVTARHGRTTLLAQ